MLMKFSRFYEIRFSSESHVAQIALEQKTPTENHPSISSTYKCFLWCATIPRACELIRSTALNPAPMKAKTKQVAPDFSSRTSLTPSHRLGFLILTTDGAQHVRRTTRRRHPGDSWNYFIDYFCFVFVANIGSIINHTLFDSVLFLSNVRYQSNIILSAHMIQQIVCRWPADFGRFLGNYIVDVVLNLEASCVNVKFNWACNKTVYINNPLKIGL